MRIKNRTLEERKELVSHLRMTIRGLERRIAYEEAAIEKIEGHKEEPIFRVEKSKPFTICTTGANPKENGFYESRLNTVYKVSENEFADIKELEQSFHWYMPSERSSAFEIITPDCPMYDLGMEFHYCGSLSDIYVNTELHNLLLNYDSNLLVETLWIADYQLDLWGLYLWHTRPLKDIPKSLMPDSL